MIVFIILLSLSSSATSMNDFSKNLSMTFSGRRFRNATKRLGLNGFSPRYSLYPIKYCMYGFYEICSTSLWFVRFRQRWI